MTPLGSQQSSQLSQSSDIAAYGLILPSSTPDRLTVVAPEHDTNGQDRNDMAEIDKLLQLDEPDFTFGEDGDIIELTPSKRAAILPATPTAVVAPSMHSDVGISAKVRQEHEEGQQRGAQVSFFKLLSPDLHHTKQPSLTHSLHFIIHLFITNVQPTLLEPHSISQCDRMHLL